MYPAFVFVVSTTFKRGSEWARAQLVPWVAWMYANWMPSDLTMSQLINPCLSERSIPRGPIGPAAGAASESPSGVGAPETTRGRDKMERARIWRRDRMAQTMLELEEYSTTSLNLCKIIVPQAMCVVWS